MADDGAEERFAYRRPPLGQAKGGVLVGDEVRVEHPLLRSPAVVPLPVVAAAVRLSAVEPELPVLRRDPRVVDFTQGSRRGNEVALALRPPVHVGPFRRGADRPLHLKRGERGRGVLMDVLKLPMEDAEGLVGALSRRGVRRAPTLAAAVVLIGEEATGPELDQKLRERAARQRRSAFVLAGMAPAIAAMAAVRISVDMEAPVGTVGRAVAAACGWAAVLALPAAALAGAVGRRARGKGSSSVALGWAQMVGPLVVILGSLLIGVSIVRDRAGPAFVAGAGLAASLCGALVLALAYRVASRPVAPGPFDERPLAPAPAWAVAVLGTLLVAWAAHGEPGRAADLRMASAAVPAARSLPGGWVGAPTRHVYRGTELSPHRCNATRTAGIDRSYSGRSPDGHEGALLVVAVFAAPTEAEAARDLAAAGTPADATCGTRAATKSALVRFPLALSETSSRRASLPDVGVPAVLGEYVTTVTRSDGSRATVYTSQVRLRVGRLLVRMRLTSSGARPYDRNELAAVVRAVARQAEAAYAQ
ncbi:MAG TPA: hypothetical protein VFJ85_16885 [Acidimicrobiales bacterium]|nr:hypothetical protein [Acidimicrobiales bacterium]